MQPEAAFALTTTTAGKLSSSFTATPSVRTAYRVSVCKYRVHSIKNESPVLPPLPSGHKNYFNSGEGQNLKYNRKLALYLKVSNPAQSMCNSRLATNRLFGAHIIKKKQDLGKKANEYLRE